MSDELTRLNAALGERYTVKYQLGRGGMATVYLAEDLKHRRKVAVKVLRPELAVAVGSERFLREIEVTANLQHPNILPLYDSGEADGLLYYVMPHVEGSTLQDRLKREKRLSTEETVRIAGSVAEALQFAHDRGVIHRDIKPDNILFQAEQAVVADFGVAIAVSHVGDMRLTQAGFSTGTPLYMSPEQASAEEVDGRSDQYALACVVYELLAGEPPFHAASDVGVIARHLTDPVPSLTTVRPSVGADLERVITRALSKEPADRYPSVREFATALSAAASGEARGLVRGGARPRHAKRRWPRLVTIAAVFGFVWLGWWLATDRRPLDPNRVVVFPLVTAGAADGSLGEDVATMIGHALDGVGPLRWIDGWTLLDQNQRDDVRLLSHEQALNLGRGRQSGHIVTGRVVTRGDTAEVLLDLFDVAGDSVVVRASASGRADATWQTGLQAVNGLLPSLIESVPPRFGQALIDRQPVAVANFLLAERHFRRARGADAIVAYRAAFDADSGFALAAMRGAQAATWEHDDVLAQSLTEAALRLPLSERDRLFAHGLLARLRGSADSAVTFFEGAIAADSNFVEAWMQLGETYWHLVPKRVGGDSIITVALQRAAMDSTATNVLFHLIEQQIRDDRRLVDPLMLRHFLAAGPDEELSSGLIIGKECVERLDPAAIEAHARRDPARMTITGRWLATAGHQLHCAEAMFRGALGTDIEDDDAAEGRISAALTGLHNVLMAQGRSNEALSLLDSARVSTDALRREGSGPTPWSGASPAAWDKETRLRARHLLMIDAMLGVEVGDRQEAVAAEDLAEWGEDLSGGYTDDYWRRAVWEAWRGEISNAEAWLAVLEERAPTESDRMQAMIDVIPAHIALARGDSAAALTQFARARPRSPQPQLAWHFAYSMGLERLLEAKLLLAAGRYREAIDVASLLDAPPIMYLLYLRPSLEVRIAAAEALGDGRRAEGFRSRLEGLGRRE